MQRLLIALMVGLLGIGALAPVTVAQDDRTCEDFAVPVAAQIALIGDDDLAPALDPDGNGTACDHDADAPAAGNQPGAPTDADLPSGLDCTDVDAYEWAQSVFDAAPEANPQLDAEGDGIACAELPRGGAAPALWTNSIPEDVEEATLVSVTDGDTIRVQREGQPEDEAVRLILIDTPESVDPNTPDECFGDEASAFAALLLGLADDGTLYLETDVSETDQFGRLLRYVWLEIDSEVYLLNEAIVRSGFGALSTFPPDVQYVDQLRAAQDFATEYGLGLWGPCGGIDTPLAVAEPAPAPVQQEPAAPAPAPAPAEPAGDCHPSYPSLCLPGSPDLDCGDVGARQFPVVPPDPHGFDGDGDGVGCES